MQSGEIRDSDSRQAAVSGSAFAAERRRELGDPAASPVLLIDAELRVVAVAGAAGSYGDPSSAIRAPLVEVIDTDDDAVARAAADAVGGIETSVTVETRSDGPATLRCLPLRGGELGMARAMVAVSPARRPVEAELDELRARAGDLESLGRAARALARSTTLDDIGRIVCEAAGDAATADVAALLVPSADDTALDVVSSSEPEIFGATLQLAQSSLAGRAYREADAVYERDLMPHGAEAWPLRQCGARSAAWHPIQGERGARALIALGWRRPVRMTERLRASLELLAGEAAVAMDRATALERLTVLARTDPLTDLSNRRAWQEELARELSRADRGGERLSIALIDLDEFKAFNDRWGHAAGDRLLFTAAARWRRRLRLTDLLARIGGDEFAAILPACGIEQAVTLGDQLRGAMPDGLSCTIGVAEWVAGEPAERLLDRADRALYAAKGAGRNRVAAAPTPTEAPH